MSIIEDSWKALFESGTDAVDAAGDAEQARIIQAIDIINAATDSMQGEMSAGKEEFIAIVKDTIAKMKTELLNGNIDAANKLKTGLESRINGLKKTYDIGTENILNAYSIIEGDLNTAKFESQNFLTSARDTARGDITAGRDNALTRLRTSLTKSLDSIASGRDQASQAIRQSLDRTRQNYAPYIQAGQKAITRAEQLTNDPQAQLDYVQNNPFYKTMQETARDQLFSNQAARGRLGTGETLDELDKRTLLLGEQLVGNAIDRNLGVSNQGLNATNNMATADMNGGNILAQIFQNAANAEVAANTNFGNVGAEIDVNAANNLANIAQTYGQDSSRLTQTTANNISQIGANFLGMLNSNLMSLGTMGANAESEYWNNLFNLVNNQTQQHMGLTGQAGMAEAGAQQDYRNNYANLISWAAGNVAPMLMNLGQSEANEAIGERNAETQGLNTLMQIVGLAMTGMPNLFGGGKPTTNTSGYSYSSVPFGTTSVSTGGMNGPFNMGNMFPAIYNPNPVPSNYGFNLNLSN